MLVELARYCTIQKKVVSKLNEVPLKHQCKHESLYTVNQVSIKSLD